MKRKRTFIFCLIVVVVTKFFALISPHVSGQTYVPITNYHNGISIGISGIQGADYVFDRYYHDPLVNDCGLCYIKSDVEITLAHNANNSRVRQNNVTEIIGGDFGTIRYKVDRDWQEMYWAGDNGEYAQSNHSFYPEYPGPISFNDMEYETGVPVVGTTGFKPGIPVTDRQNFYSRGLVDAAGNEYHYFTYADDDDQQPDWKNLEMSASDGKSMLFCVNPKTPTIWLSAAVSGAQYYTTPGKVYWVPKFHEQISYVMDNIDINLKNIMNSNTVYYRIDGGTYQPYVGAISSNTLSHGEHTLEFYYNPAFVQTRKIVKNPEHPSKQDVFEDGSGHGYILWKNEAEVNRWRSRVLTGGNKNGDYSFYKSKMGSVLNWAGNTGVRNPTIDDGDIWSQYALMLVLVPAVEGVDDNKNYLEAAKRYLLNTPRMHIENVGMEVNHSQDPNPCHELTYRGYYDDWLLFGPAFIYDYLAKEYRSDQRTGGMSPIEDIRIRDMLAVPVHECMMTFGGYSMKSTPQTTTEPTGGMWSTARQSAALCAALAMPSYNTNYLGTSGFDGTPAIHAYTPYPDYPESWKDLFLTYTDKDNPKHADRLHPFPNRQSLFNWYDGTMDAGLIREDGNWHDRVPYTSTSNMGHGIEIFYNVMKRKFNISYPNLDLFMMKSVTGTLEGHKFSISSDYGPHGYPRRNMANEYFPALAPIAMTAYDDDNKYFYRARPYGILFNNPEWASVTMCESAEPGTVPANLSGTSGSFTASLVWSASLHAECSVRGYIVRRDGVDIDTVQSLNYTDSNVTSNTQYSYSVASVSEAGVVSDFCTALQVTTKEPVSVSGVSVSPLSHYLEAGQEFQLAAIVLPTDAANLVLTWATNDATIATVDANGLITAIAEGNAIITVTTDDGGYTATCDITVNAVSVSSGLVETCGNGTASTIATYTGWDTGASVIFSGYNTNPGVNIVATTNPSNTYTGASGGSNVQIAPGYTETAWFLIEGINTTGLTDITLSFGLYYTSVTATTGLKVSVSTDGTNWTELPHGTFPGNATWGVMTYDKIPIASNLRIKIEEANRKAINIDDIKVDGIISEISVTGVSISQSTLTLDKGQTSDLTESVGPANATDHAVTWSSSNTSVASVDTNGLVTAVSAGNASITVTTNDGAHTASCDVTVREIISSIKKSYTGTTINIYPNPVNDDILNIKISGAKKEGKAIIQLVDITGRVMSIVQKQVFSNSQLIQMALGDAKSGIYVLHVKYDSISYMRKIVVK